MDTEVHEEVAQPVRKVEERKHDQHQQVELDQRVANDVDPCVVVAVDDRDDAERAEDALDEHVHRKQKRSDHSALGEEEPEEEVTQRGPATRLAHRANQMSTNPTTADASAQVPNIVTTITCEGTGRSKSLTRMITPASFRNV